MLLLKRTPKRGKKIKSLDTPLGKKTKKEQAQNARPLKWILERVRWGGDSLAKQRKKKPNEKRRRNEPNTPGRLTQTKHLRRGSSRKPVRR